MGRGRGRGKGQSETRQAEVAVTSSVWKRRSLLRGLLHQLGESRIDIICFRDAVAAGRNLLLLCRRRSCVCFWCLMLIHDSLSPQRITDAPALHGRSSESVACAAQERSSFTFAIPFCVSNSASAVMS